MKRLGLILALLAIFGPLSAEAASPMSSKGVNNSRKTVAKSSKNRFTVTLTCYWAVGRGSDYWTRRFTSSTGNRLISGVSAAADPRVIPYGSVIEIEGVGRRIVKDTGTHVIQRLASRKRGVDYPVIDLFFASRQEALNFARNHPPFAQVTILSREA